MATRRQRQVAFVTSPKFSAYLAFAASTSSRILVIASPPIPSCPAVAYQERMYVVPTHLALVALSSAVEPPQEHHGSAMP
jgi:hypothetical protein